MSAVSEFVGVPRHGDHPGSAPVGAAVGAVPQGAPAEDRQGPTHEGAGSLTRQGSRHARGPESGDSPSQLSLSPGSPDGEAPPRNPTPPPVSGVYPPVTPGTGWEVPWIR